MLYRLENTNIRLPILNDLSIIKSVARLSRSLVLERMIIECSYQQNSFETDFPKQCQICQYFQISFKVMKYDEYFIAGCNGWWLVAISKWILTAR